MSVLCVLCPPGAALHHLLPRWQRAEQHRFALTACREWKQYFCWISALSAFYQHVYDLLQKPVLAACILE